MAIDCCEMCELQIIEATREMRAFVSAVHYEYGSLKASFAAKYWVEFAASASAPLINVYPNWRSITIAAADRLTFDLLGTPSLMTIMRGDEP